MSGKLPMQREVVEIVLRTGRVPQDVVSGMEEQPFGNLQHTVRISPASTFEIPRPASEVLSQLLI